LVKRRTHLSARKAIAADLIKSESQVRRCESGVEPLISKRAARAKRFNDLTATRQRHEFPADFSIRYFQPGNTWRRATIRPGHAAGIEKQNTTASFIARNVRMGVQENIYIIRRMIGWNVLQSEFQTASQKINDKRPLKIGIAISAHDDHARTNRAKLVKNASAQTSPRCQISSASLAISFTLSGSRLCVSARTKTRNAPFDSSIFSNVNLNAHALKQKPHAAKALWLYATRGLSTRDPIKSGRYS